MQIRDIRQTTWFWMDNAILDIGLSVYELSVYCLLCRMANKENTCFPSVKTIALKLDISERQVYNCLNSLKEHKVLKVESGNSEKSNVYSLLTAPDAVRTAQYADTYCTPCSTVLNDMHTNNTNITKLNNNKDASLHTDSTQPKKQNNFTPPTLEEVQAYCKVKGYRTNPMTFWAFYGSKDWVVGKTKMKNWHLALAGWEARENGQSTAPSKKYLL